MNLGNLIFLSITGYIILLIHDLSQMFKNRIITLISLISYPIILLPYILIFILYVPDYKVPIVLIILHYVLISTLSILLVYSVLLEIPFKTRNNKQPSDIKTRSVYKEGTYSFSRHPGFIWMTLLNAVIYSIFLHRDILILTALLTLCNLALIILEDLFIFPNIFHDYKQFKQEVPFICKIPFKKKIIGGE
ncbi:MAG: hypothetical protein KAQ69_11415 [Spirochaetales bacterium]|nr:hypothetical protein [Spirochaetales bacterium]